MQFDWILRLPRVAGHTTAACGKSDRNPVVVTTNQRQAEQIKREYGVEAVGLNRAAAVLQGRYPHPPVVFDLHAVQMIVSHYESCLDNIKQTMLDSI